MRYKKKKKSVRLRGSKTHGWGSMKKHRGAGNRGGRGKAGRGKRAKQKKPSILKEFGLNYLGKKGFNRPQKVIKKSKAINIKDLHKFKTKEINLTKLGFTKLLSIGDTKEKYNIIVNSYSKKAKEKIEKAGGSITTKK